MVRSFFLLICARQHWGLIIVGAVSTYLQVCLTDAPKTWSDVAILRPVVFLVYVSFISFIRGLTAGFYHIILNRNGKCVWREENIM